MKLKVLTASIVALLLAFAGGPSRAGPGDVATPASTAPVESGLPPMAQAGIEWLVKAQHPDGGWGAGSHAAQHVRDPRQVVTDPATTAFTTMTLLRAGHTPTAGEHREVVRRAVTYLVQAVEKAPREGPRVTELQGTQIQAKLGPLVDTAMTTQLLARVMRLLPQDDPLRGTVAAALELCVTKLQRGQAANGSWGAGGWAPVLQSSLATSALEVARAAGTKVDDATLERAREYQQGNFDRASGRAAAGDGAGVELYALAGAQRANEAEAAEARRRLEEAKRDGRVDADAPLTAPVLEKAGVAAPRARELAQAAADSEALRVRMQDAGVLQGFGNNGGEEFLSFLLAGEAAVIAGDARWAEWRASMEPRLAAARNPDGSWSGHHCITSPVFCTAAVVQALTADRDAQLLRQLARDTQPSQPSSPPDAPR